MYSHLKLQLSRFSRTYVWTQSGQKQGMRRGVSDYLNSAKSYSPDIDCQRCKQLTEFRIPYSSTA